MRTYHEIVASALLVRVKLREKGLPLTGVFYVTRTEMDMLEGIEPFPAVMDRLAARGAPNELYGLKLKVIEEAAPA